MSSLQTLHWHRPVTRVTCHHTYTAWRVYVCPQPAMTRIDDGVSSLTRPAVARQPGSLSSWMRVASHRSVIPPSSLRPSFSLFPPPTSLRLSLFPPPSSLCHRSIPQWRHNSDDMHYDVCLASSFVTATEGGAIIPNYQCHLSTSKVCLLSSLSSVASLQSSSSFC